LFSCAADITKLAGLFISHDLSLGFLKPAISMLMVQPSAASEGNRRGLGWALNSGGLVPGRAFSDLAFGHNGFTGVSVWTDPADGLTVTLLTNRVYFNEAKAWRPVNYFRNRVHRLAKLLLRAT
jgi:CubicO group peptidase (beta-lactamase class C family)